MEKAIAIRFDFSKERNDPAVILELLSGYVKVYQDISELTGTVIGFDKKT